MGLWTDFWWQSSLFWSYLGYQAKENGLDYQQGKNECWFTTIFLVTQKCWNNQPHPITLKIHIYIVIKTDCRERGWAQKMLLIYTSHCLSADLAEAHEEAGHSRASVLHFSCLQDQRETWNPFHHWTLHQLRHSNGPEFRRASRALDPSWRGLTVSA